MTSKTTFADVNSTKLVNKINDLTIGEDSTDLLVVNSNVNATNGLDVTGGALTITDQAITQSGSGQVTFTGNVGIGTNNPHTNLHIESTGSEAKLIIKNETLALLQLVQPTSNKTYNIELGRTDGDLTFFSTDERMRITEGGNVGIGTDNPQSKLHMFEADLRLDGGESNRTKPRIVFEEVTNDQNIEMIYDGSLTGAGNFFAIRSGYSGWDNVGINYIPSNGNVGIGNTSPTEKLDINGNLHIEGDYICIRSDSNNDGNTGKPALYFSEDNYNSSVSTSHNDSGNVRIIYDGDGQSGDNNFIAIQGRTAANQFNNTLLHCETGGNVGIGTNNPSQKLEVNGNLKVNGNVESNNNGIVQVKSSSFLGTLSGSSGSWITGLNVSITPSSSTNKIFLNLDLHWSGVQDAYFQGFIYRFVGGGSQQLVVRHNGVGNATRCSFGNRNNNLGGHPYQLENLGFSYLDSPNTTSNISYRVYVRNRGSGHGAFYINYTSSTNDSNRLTGVSTFTAFEVVP